MFLKTYYKISSRCDEDSICECMDSTDSAYDTRDDDSVGDSMAVSNDDSVADCSTDHAPSIHQVETEQEHQHVSYHSSFFLTMYVSSISVAIAIDMTRNTSLSKVCASDPLSRNFTARLIAESIVFVSSRMCIFFFLECIQMQIQNVLHDHDGPCHHVIHH